MLKIYIADGTGPGNDAEYIEDMSRGFCWKINTQIQDTFYLRGPTLLGLETWQIGDILFEQIQADRKANPLMKIILVGHSRGGAICVYVARKLKEAGNIPVHAMLLFDAVRRTINPLHSYMGTVDLNLAAVSPGVFALAVGTQVALDLFTQTSRDIVSSNVERTLHFVRDEDFSNFFINCDEYLGIKAEEKNSGPPSSRGATADQKLKSMAIGCRGTRINKLKVLHKNLRNACRFDLEGSGIGFGNTALRSEGKMTLVKCKATHGAIGGAPLEVKSYIDEPRYADIIKSLEAAEMLRIQSMVNSFLSEIGAFCRGKDVNIETGYKFS